MNKQRTYAHRGKVLENLIDMTNNQYRNKGIADIRKIPTPVQITGNIGGGKVTGRLEKGEWVDYVGVGLGRAMIFDAKESKVERFEMKNLHIHQYELLKSWWEKGAWSFLIVSFAHKNEEIYVLDFVHLHKAWLEYVGTGKKSIPYQFFVENCDKIGSKNGYVLHYLDVIQKQKGAVV